MVETSLLPFVWETLFPTGAGRYMDEWERAEKGIRILDGALPFIAVPGNHDYDRAYSADGGNCFISDYDHLFAENCVSLMKDSALREKISRQGYETVRKHYSWGEKLAGYDKIALTDGNAHELYT